MIPVIIIVMIAMIILVLGMARGEAMLSETDLHYQFVPIAVLSQNAANDYTEVVLESGETPTNSGSTTITNEIKGEFVPNAFGKNNHGVSVWDIKSWVFQTNRTVEIEAGQLNQMDLGVHSDDSTRTTPITPDTEGYIVSVSEEANDTQTAAGNVQQAAHSVVNKIDMPQDIIDGNTWGYLATKQRYVLFIDGNGEDVSANAVRLGIWARRVIVPLTEVFFDRDTIAGLLDSVILSQILG